MCARAGHAARLLWIAAGLCLACGPVHAASEAGSHAFEFLRLPAEPVGRTMAGAHLATVGGPAALAWNPAGLADGAASAVVLSHAAWTAGTAWEWGALAFPVRGAALGIAGGMLRNGELHGFDAEGQPSGAFSPYQACVAVGCGVPLRSDLNIGVGLEGALDSDGLGTTYRAWAASAGLQYAVGIWHVAVAALHVGPPLSAGDERYPLPSTLRGGASVDLGSTAQMHAALELLRGEDPAVLVGFGWRPIAALCGMGGARLEPAAGSDGFRPSLGFTVDLGTTRFAYSFQPAGDLEASHQVALSVTLRSSRRALADKLPD